jgi:hypothetical protein
MPIDAVIFDYGKVLSNPEDPEAQRKLIALAGLERPDFDDFYWRHRNAYNRETPPAAHSRHLAYLRRAGIVNARRETGAALIAIILAFGSGARGRGPRRCPTRSVPTSQLPIGSRRPRRSPILR